MQLTLLRHAEVQHRFKNKYNGHNNISLSPRGKAQAKRVCQKLNKIKFDLVFASDLKRSYQTATYLKHPIVYTSQLREKSWGKHEGLDFDTIIAQNEIQYENFLQWIEALDGEDYKSYIDRIKKFFFKYLPSLKKRHILIITHAGVIRVFLSVLHKISLEDAFSIKINYGEYIIENI